jgi:hypothetical protein
MISNRFILSSLGTYSMEFGNMSFEEDQLKE